jgi:hypothetical protein
MGLALVCRSAEGPIDLMCCLIEIVSLCYIVNVVDPSYCFYVDLCSLFNKVCIIEGV